jgi:ElaB/YqjD/DUF883 family membrane-anchored ribosome-binding protein
MASDTRQKVGKAYETVRDDVHAIRDDLSVLKSDATRAARDLAHAGADMARERAGAALDQAKRLGDQFTTSYEKACDFVKERPVTSILIAVGVGAIAARLLTSRR